MPRWRVGVALLLQEPLASEVNGLRRASGDGSLERIVPHITLIPPVNVRVEDVPNALRVLRDAAKSQQPFAIDVGPVATFHPETPTLTLAVEGEGSDKVREFRDAIFTPPLERTLTWPFVPHVTLSDDASPERIEAALIALRDYQASPTFDRVHLLREEPGRKWEPVADVPFGEPAVFGRGGIETEILITDQADPETVGVLSGAHLNGADSVATARRDGVPVGVIAARKKAAGQRVQCLFVDPDHRGQGVSFALIKAFTNHHGSTLFVDAERLNNDAVITLQAAGIRVSNVAGRPTA